MALPAAPAPAPAPSSYRKGSILDLVVGIGIGVFFFLLLLGLVIARSLRKIKWRAALRSLQNKLGWKVRVDNEAAPFDLEARLSQLNLPSRYTYKELAIATKNFSSKELIGGGGFAQVYKARFSQDGSYVAVKKISQLSPLADNQFLAEMAIIGRIRHRNLVQLKGWCYEKVNMLLVYDYMPNGSLDKHLVPTSTTVLKWSDRYEIVKGVAAGLSYLHEGSGKRIIHNDVKPSNVLLDADFNPRLSDFGLAICIESGEIAQTVNFAGTLGFVAPEIHNTGRANEKSDVYSFGMLLLTVACGKAALDGNPANEDTLLNWVWHLQSRFRLLDAADARLVKQYNVTEMICLLQLGLICCHPDPNARPWMRNCCQMLLGDATIPALAQSKPSLFPLSSLEINGELLSGYSSSGSRRLSPAESSTCAMLSRNLSLEITSIE